MPTINTSKTFTVTAITEKIFSVIGDLNIIPTWLLNLQVPSINLSFDMKLIKRLEVSLTIPTIVVNTEFLIPQMDVMPQNYVISIPVPSFDIILSQIQKFSIAVSSGLAISPEMTLNQIVSTALVIPVVDISWDIFVGILYVLDDYDADTLADMDFQQLGDLDKVAS